jgi:hypothetical protein
MPYLLRCFTKIEGGTDKVLGVFNGNKKDIEDVRDYLNAQVGYTSGVGLWSQNCPGYFYISEPPNYLNATNEYVYENCPTFLEAIGYRPGERWPA